MAARFLHKIIVSPEFSQMMAIEKVVYHTLRGLRNKRKEVYHKLESLTKWAGVSRQAFIDAIRNLQALGAIEVRQETYKGSKSRHNVYSVPDEPVLRSLPNRRRKVSKERERTLEKAREAKKMKSTESIAIENSAVTESIAIEYGVYGIDGISTSISPRKNLSPTPLYPPKGGNTFSDEKVDLPIKQYSSDEIPLLLKNIELQNKRAKESKGTLIELSGLPFVPTLELLKDSDEELVKKEWARLKAEKAAV
jgi:hypothetical protein